MKFYPIKGIVIRPDRQRREHDEDAHQQLVESIKLVGLLHPPVTRQLDGEEVLVAGERRLRAIAEIQELGGSVSYAGRLVPDGQTPVTPIGELTALEAEEAELEENLRRKDLDFKDRALAEQRVFALRQAQAAAAGQVPPTQQEVASELMPEASPGAASSALMRNLVIARNLHRPEVARAKSADEAFKALKRVVETERNAGVAASLGPDAEKRRLYGG